MGPSVQYCMTFMITISPGGWTQTKLQQKVSLQNYLLQGPKSPRKKYVILDTSRKCVVPKKPFVAFCAPFWAIRALALYSTVDIPSNVLESCPTRKKRLFNFYFIYVMSDEKIKKKLNGQFFFLVGSDSSSSEESSTVEYSAFALMCQSVMIFQVKMTLNYLQ